jgi:protein-disulfide isomerase
MPPTSIKPGVSTYISRLSLPLAGAGWLLSAWLLLASLAFGGGRLPIARADVVKALCPHCSTVLGSSSSWQLGVPLAGWGLIYFAVIGILLIAAAAATIRIAFVLTSIGVGASVVFTAAALQSRELCALCLLVHLANVGLLAALWQTLRKDGRISSLSVLRSATAFGAVTAFAIVTGVFVELALWHPTANARQVVDEFRSGPRVDIPIAASDPVLGPRDAKVRLVVFSSFQCPACKNFAKLTRLLNQQYPDELAIVFKHFPLGKECNPTLKREMQPRACATALAAQAANRQNAFWGFHDRVFAGSLREDEKSLKAVAADTGLDMDQWEADRNSASVKQDVLRDVAMGASLQIDGTPSMFLNGRKLKALSNVNLQSLIEQEIAEGTVARLR